MLELERLNQKLKDASRKNTKTKWLIPTVLAAVFILVLLICGTLIASFEITYQNKFFPGSKIGGVDLSNLTKDQAFKMIEEKASKIDQEAIKIKYTSQGQEKNVLLAEIINPDSARDFLEYDIYRTVYDNFNLGRSRNFLSNLMVQWRIFNGRQKMSAKLNLDKGYLKGILQNQFSDLEILSRNASPEITCLKDNCSIDISQEENGSSFNYDEAINSYEAGLNDFYNYPIVLKFIVVKPVIVKSEGNRLLEQLKSLLNGSTTPEYYYQDDKWSINRSSFSSMLIFDKSEQDIYLNINRDSFNKWFDLNIAKKLNVEAQNATIQINNGQVSSLSTQKNGQEVDKEKAYQDLNTKLINNDFSNLSFQLVVRSTTPSVAVENINNLGIKEIIGTGQSNFAGSPTNRRKNIKNGANKLHGLLIKPGEEFSLIKNLLPVDAASGYFPELVIKENKTIPEYGGGLCQIGTTIFRAALSSGLPILERQNHSYNVTYYLEKGLPGVDATIYDPKPDLRFKNDTNNYILIQARISGDNLYFDFWGTKDGRTAGRTKPKTWGVKSPLPTKIIESTDLLPGQKKCTETAHKGISASFNYIVGYPDGHTATTTFTSVYKPWQEVCLVGANKSSSTVVSLDNP